MDRMAKGMNRRQRNHNSNRPQRFTPARRLLISHGLEEYLRAPPRRRRVSTTSQAPNSQQAEQTQTPDTYSAITHLTSPPLRYSRAHPVEVSRPPTAEGQPVPAAPPYPFIPAAPFHLPVFDEYYASSPTLGSSTTMRPSNTRGHGYHPSQSASDIYFQTPDTFTYTNLPSANAGQLQGQNSMTYLYSQTEDTQNTFHQVSQWQQPLPSRDFITPSFWIRRRHNRWVKIEVIWELDTGPSYLLASAAVASGWPLEDFEIYRPGYQSQSRTRDGLITPNRWVTVDMKDDVCGSLLRDVNIAIYPLPQPIWTSATLIMGRNLWQTLYPLLGNDPAASFETLSN
ncbi:hypothetical protein NCS52_00335300 [Fusarium sp. LHS14.1]|nr:hypothetical protein NCS52_00335300 [Fusarium sp. LHS14.1]